MLRIHERFLDVCARQPNAPALFLGDDKCTYAKLLQRCRCVQEKIVPLRRALERAGTIHGRSREETLVGIFLELPRVVEAALRR